MINHFFLKNIFYLKKIFVACPNLVLSKEFWHFSKKYFLTKKMFAKCCGTRQKISTFFLK